jgi:MFS family permease
LGSIEERGDALGLALDRGDTVVARQNLLSLSRERAIEAHAPARRHAQKWKVCSSAISMTGGPPLEIFAAWARVALPRSFMGARRCFLVSALLGLAGLGLLLLGSRPLALAGIACCGLGFANVWPLVFSLTVESRPERSGALSGLMCMAIVGGAVMPPLMGLVADRAGVRLAFLVPLAAFVYLALLALGGRGKAAAAPPPSLSPATPPSQPAPAALPTRGQGRD